MNNHNGRVLGAANIPQFNKASGIWRPTYIATQQTGLGNGLRFPPNTQDPYFSQVTVLLHFDDTCDFNGKECPITDWSSVGHNVGYNAAVGYDSGFQTKFAFHHGFGAVVADLGQNRASANIGRVQVSGITTPDILGTNDFTIEGWYTLNTGCNSAIWDWRVGVAGNGPFLFVGSDGHLEYDLAAVTKATTAAGAVTLGNNHWYHIAYTRATVGGVSTGRIMVDGSSLASWADNTNYTSGGQLGVSLSIGNNVAGTSGMKGFCAEFRVTNGTARYTGSSYTVPTVRFPDF